MGKSLIEDACSPRPLLKRQNRPTAILVDNRYVEPGSFPKQFEVSLPVAFKPRELDEEAPCRGLRRTRGERYALCLLAELHQDARHAGDGPVGNVGCRIEGDFNCMASWRVSASPHGENRIDVAWDLNIAAHCGLEQTCAFRWHGFDAPRNRAGITPAVRVGRILV